MEAAPAQIFYFTISLDLVALKDAEPILNSEIARNTREFKKFGCNSKAVEKCSRWTLIGPTTGREYHTPHACLEATKRV